MTWQPMPECNPGWQRNPDVEIVQVANYGSGERVGRCLPVGSFLCMAGGRDRSSYIWFDAWDHFSLSCHACVDDTMYQILPSAIDKSRKIFFLNPVHVSDAFMTEQAN